MNIREIATLVRSIGSDINTIVVDQQEAAWQIMLAVACGGHVLIQDVPGVGKTTMARAFAQSLGLQFHRIQGTPDRLPTEITGTSIWDTHTSQFRFVPGPIFGQFVLFDELNRAPSKTQSALLEAMEEGQVTIDGVAHELPRPFIVLATQNPIELEGTFPLPEAALDRFFVQVHLGYPTHNGELRLLQNWSSPAWRKNATGRDTSLKPLLDQEGIFALRKAIETIHFSQDTAEYVLSIVEETRKHAEILLGLSPRAGLAIKQASQAWAAFEGRDFVKPDDVRQVLIPCGAHRMILHPEAELRRRTPAKILDEIVRAMPVPGSWTAVGAEKRGS
jgi:MoxR-like ATPase